MPKFTHNSPFRLSASDREKVRGEFARLMDCDGALKKNVKDYCAKCDSNTKVEKFSEGATDDDSNDYDQEGIA